MAIGLTQVLRCEPDVLRGTLKHSHLENVYLRATQVCLPDILREINRTENVPTHETTRRLISRLVGAIEEGFCATPLVDRLAPLGQLPEPQKEQLRRAIRQKYREEFKPEERRAALEKAARVFTTALDAFLAANDPARPQESDDAQYQALMKASQCLFREVEALPKGMFLWPDNRSRI